MGMSWGVSSRVFHIVSRIATGLNLTGIMALRSLMRIRDIIVTDRVDMDVSMEHVRGYQV